MSRLNRFQDELGLIFIYKVVSEVGVFTWNWPEGDLFVFLENNIISTETLLAFQVCETDSENPELIFGLQHVPSGEFERHFLH